MFEFIILMLSAILLTGAPDLVMPDEDVNTSVTSQETSLAYKMDLQLVKQDENGWKVRCVMLEPDSETFDVRFEGLSEGTCESMVEVNRGIRQITMRGTEPLDMNSLDFVFVNNYDDEFCVLNLRNKNF